MFASIISRSMDDSSHAVWSFTTTMPSGTTWHLQLNYSCDLAHEAAVRLLV